MARPQTSPMLIPQSLPPNMARSGWHKELAPLLGGDEQDEEWGEEEEDEGAGNNWLQGGYSRSYGAAPTHLHDQYSRGHNSGLSPRHRERRKRRHLRSTTVASITSLTNLFDSEDRSSERRDSASSLGEDPPIVEMIYRRSFKDLFKLILLPAIYFLFMVVAVIFAFYTIQGLVLSYSNHVQSVQIKKVDNAYDPVGIVIMPQFSSYVGCDYRYFDDLSPNKTTVISCGNLSIPVNCTHVNVTFNSTIIEGATRKAMVFRSPTLVYCKQNLRIHYMIDTGVREFSAVEYMLLPSWEHFISSDLETQRNQLADLEKNSIIYTFPSGFRTWVKLSYSVRINSQGEVQSPEFYVRASYATYTSTNMTEAILPMEVVFEWASPFYNQIQEVISTTAFSAIGSLCGIFITLIKAGEFCRMWLRRIRREKQKKLLHLQELEKRQQELLEDYERRKKERREAKLKAKSMLEDSSKKDSLP